MEIVEHFFIVCSPLQLRIVSQIKARYANARFHVIYLKTKVELKPYIYEVIERDFDSGLVANMDYGFINMLKIKQFLKHKNIRYVYMANISHLSVQYILKMLPKDVGIRTFDDGILSINSVGYLDRQIKLRKGISRKLTRVWLGKSYGIKEIADKSELHYSIVKNENKNMNVNCEVVYIDILADQSPASEIESATLSRKGEINIFVGSKFKDILSQKNDDNLAALMNKIKSIAAPAKSFIYLRHPREKSSQLFGMKEIVLNSISEDYICQLSSTYQRVNVYGFASTCQLNVMKLDNVHLTLLKTALIRPDIRDSFALFSDSDKVTVYDLDNADASVIQEPALSLS
ncbi:glycosyltransferase family 52 [Superficieibacter sp. HKU1]|uniref:glycosyltransferase family 52 n=1 Tax=Superficieibacter sp. HKU1 TaxID=3031919 RepID=UPI0023E342F5|nr:glycosyltransferase family 52 [Superficieibacter sp. HKU1]WES68462.1 glycosyltransferase family 52 [Superficieibacter sp. HKU1]